MTGELGESMRVESPFAGRQRAAGAAHDLYFQVKLPAHFGDPLAEYQAVRRQAGLIDLSFRGVLEVTGSERARWLNGQVTNDVSGLKPGEVRLAAVLDARGHVLTDLAAYADEERFLLDLPRDRALPIQEVFDRRIIADDVTIRDLTPGTARLMLVGPAAPAILAAAAGTAVAALPPWRHAGTVLAGADARLAATRWLGEPGFDLTVPVDAAGALWDALMEAGGSRGLRPAGMRAVEWLRVEAGWRWYGLDLDPSCLLMEALTSDHVSFAKGCYTGQEVVIRIEHQGHVNRKLSGLLVSGRTVPQRGAPLLADGRTVGGVTSAVDSPALGRVIALAYVRREHWTPGTRLTVGLEPEPVEAEVTALPFVGNG